MFLLLYELYQILLKPQTFFNSINIAKIEIKLSKGIYGLRTFFISSIFFTLYIILKKFTKRKFRSYNLFFGLGYFICSLVVFSCLKFFNVTNEPWFDIYLLWACLGGFLWAMALILLMLAIDRIGVARAGQYKNLQAPLGSLLILFLLSEFKDINLYVVISAIFLTFLGALCYSVNAESGYIDLLGISMAIASAILYSINSVIRKMVTGLGFVYSQQLYSSLTIVISIMLFLLVVNKIKTNKPTKKQDWEKVRKECTPCVNNFNFKDSCIGLCAGLSYFLASILLTLSYTYISGTVAFIVSQSCAVWTALVGVFVFREMSFKKHWIRILIGLLFSVIGIMLLSFS